MCKGVMRNFIACGKGVAGEKFVKLRYIHPLNQLANEFYLNQIFFSFKTLNLDHVKQCVHERIIKNHRRRIVYKFI